MNLQEQYRKETGIDPVETKLMEQMVIHFSDDYVEWLEHKHKKDVVDAHKDSEIGNCYLPHEFAQLEKEAIKYYEENHEIKV